MKKETENLVKVKSLVVENNTNCSNWQTVPDINQFFAEIPKRC
jgi:hypothetical protein